MFSILNNTFSSSEVIEVKILLSCNRETLIGESHTAYLYSVTAGSYCLKLQALNSLEYIKHVLIIEAAVLGEL